MPNIFDRLVSQMQGKVRNPYAAATAALQRSGNMKKGSHKLTSKGKRRSMMGAGGRAKSRAAKRSGHSTGAYKYSAKTNRATLK